MLIFKKNIYFINYSFNSESPFGNESGDNEGPKPIAYNFILSSLAKDRSLFIELQKLPESLVTERIKMFFPNASRFGSPAILNRMSKRLLKALLNHRVWYQMNCYHFCYLYDTLMELVEDYSYGDRNFRENLIPELKGQPINFNQFLNEYFFHTAFLIDPGRFNSMAPKERLSLGKIDHSLLGVLPIPVTAPEDEDITLEKVINSVPPTPQDVELEVYSGNPYSR